LKLNIDHFGFLAASYERLITAAVPEKMMEILDLPENGVLLDAGGGTGRVSQFIQEKSDLIVVADPSIRMLRQANKKDGLRPVCSQAEQIPFSSEMFDRVIMVDALHHVADQARVAAEFWRVLKLGGRIVIEEPDIRSLGVKLIAVGEKILLMRSRFLSPAQIAALFTAADARVRIVSENNTAWIVIDKI
jgi:ubiquinone/menaquinone biosynthesis C-methylase UbiE